jgi:hypothetical protein
LAYKAEAGNWDRHGEDREIEARSQHLSVLINDIKPVQEPEGMPRRSQSRPIDTFVRLQSLKRCLDSLPPHVADTLRPQTLGIYSGPSRSKASGGHRSSPVTKRPTGWSRRTMTLWP